MAQMFSTLVGGAEAQPLAGPGQGLDHRRRLANRRATLHHQRSRRRDALVQHADVIPGHQVLGRQGVRLGEVLQRHVQLTGPDGVEVVDRPPGTLDAAADAVIFPALVDQPGDGAAGGIVDAGHTAGTDGDEGGFRLHRCRTKADHE